MQLQSLEDLHVEVVSDLLPGWAETSINIEAEHRRVGRAVVGSGN